MYTYSAYTSRWLYIIVVQLQTTQYSCILSCGLRASPISKLDRKSLSQHLALGIVQIFWLPKFTQRSN